MILVDSHCHLDGAEFAVDREEVLSRARQAGVEALVAIGTGDGPPDLESGIRLAEAYSNVFATIGVHPHNAAQTDDQTWKKLPELARHRRVVAWGEIGLDYHYDFAPRTVQQDVFVKQLELAAEARLPVVIHTREAWADTISILKQDWRTTGLGGIFHCFSGGPDEAQEALDLGFHLSFSGIVTFPKATAIHESARMAPADRILVETDSPYLAPVPHRGKRNEPSYVVQVARRVAELRGIPAEELAEMTTQNWRSLCLRATGS